MLKKILIFSVLCQSLLLAASSISIFPADFQNGNYAVNADNVVFLKFKFAANGNAMLTAGKTQLVIELDDSVKVVAAASEHPVKTMPLAISSGNGKAVIDLPPSYVREMIREKSVPWGAGLLIGFQASKTAVGKRFPVQFELKGGEKVFASKILKLAVHKPLPPVKQLQQLQIGHWRLHTLHLPKEYKPFFLANIRFWTQLCRKPSTSLSGTFYVIPQDWQKHILENFDCTLLMHSCHDTPVVLGTPYKFFDENHRVSRPGVPKLIGADGKEIRGAICPRYLLKDPENIFWSKHITEGLRDLLKKSPGAKTICIDYESMPQNGVCNDCRADFAAQYKLPLVPTVNDVVKGKYRSQWRMYRAKTRNQIVKRLSDVIHKEFPDVTFRMCTVSLKPEEPWINNWSGLDVKGMDPFVDEFENMLYTAGKAFYNYLEYNIKELSKPQRVLCDPAETDIRWFQRYTPATVRQNILTTFGMGCKAFILYPDDYYDAAYMTMFAETFSAVAEVENALLKGAVKGKLTAQALNVSTIELSDGKAKRKITAPDFSSDFKFMHHRDGKNDAVTLLNFSDSDPIIARIAIVDYNNSQSHVSELLTRTAFTGITAENIRKGFLVKIEPNGALLLKLGEKSATECEVTQSAIQNDLDKSLAAAAKNTEHYKPLFGKIKKNTRIAYIISRNDPAVELVDHGAYLHIDPKRGGKFTAWRIPGLGEFMGSGNRKSIGEFFLRNGGNHLPNPIPYTITDRVIDQNGVKIVMNYTVPPDQDAGGDGNPLEGLKITRTVTLKDYYSNVKLSHTLTNTGKKSMTFAFRLRNIPVFRWKRSTTTDLPSLAADDSQPGCGEFMYSLQGKQLDWNLLKTHKPLSTLDIYFKYGFLKLLFKFNGFTGLYMYGNDQIQTVEPLSPEITLKPGDSATFDMDILRIDTRQK